MSITKFQNTMKGGCGQAVLISIVAVFIAGLAYQGCGRGANMAQQSAGGAGGSVIGDIGGIQLSASEIDKAVSAQSAQFGGKELPGSFEIMLAGQALSQLIQQKSLLALAKERGLQPDDATMQKFIENEVEKQLSPSAVRAQLEQGGQLKPGASDADLDKVVKTLSGGKSLADFSKEQKAKAMTDLKDPEKGDPMKAQITAGMLLESYKAKVNASDDAVKASFDTYQVKRISFPSGPGAEEKANAALAKIKGGATFESVMDANTPAPAAGAKKASETPQTIPASVIASDPDYAVIKTLKAGEMTGVVKGKYDVSITKLFGTKNDLPKDWDKNKARYVDQFKSREASQVLQKDLKTYTETHKPNFTARGYEALYKYAQLSEGANPMMGGAPPTVDDAKLREVIDIAKRVDKSAPDYRVAAIVRTAAFDQLYTKAKDKAPLRSEYIETLQAQVDAKEDFDARLKLVDEYLTDKKGKDAAEQLLAAARANTDYTTAGQDRFGKVASKLLQIKKDGSLDSTVEKDILNEQDRWRNEKAASDKVAADAAKQQAEDAKRAEAAKGKPKVENIPPKK